jgi:hypothetical protein
LTKQADGEVVNLFVASGLLDKITNILLGRVKGFMDFNLLQTPERANVIAVECRAILTGWSDSFQVAVVTGLSIFRAIGFK